jgi:starvation-inducible outer membrane lipoprotein
MKPAHQSAPTVLDCSEYIMKIRMLLGASALVLGACSTEPTPLPNVETQLAVAAAASVRSNPGYRDPFAGFQNRQPTGPHPWRALNDAQARGH